LLLAQAADPAATARKAFDLLLGGKNAELFQMLTPDLQISYTEPALAKLATQTKTYGALNSVDPPAVQKSGSTAIVVLAAHFEKQNINFRYIINGAGMITGMFQLPGEISWRRPGYSKPEMFQAREITVGEGQWKLPGTLLIPTGTGPFPGVVLVHGSGASDRDETIMGGTKIFRDLAEGLASRGIATLRYEKRTKQYTARTAGLRGMTLNEELVDDAVLAAAALRAQKEIDPKRVYIVARDLGGYASPRIAGDDEKLAGIVILAGNARPIEDLILDQAEYAGVTPKQLEALKLQAAKVKALEQADADAPPILGMPAPYLLDLKGYDPVAAARALTIPMLFLQGDRDFQVTSKDLALWKAGLAGRKDVTFKTYPALNHLFIAGEGKSTEAEYRKPGNVAPEVIDDIAKWIAK
jgi:hypothetical protein